MASSYVYQMLCAAYIMTAVGISPIINSNSNQGMLKRNQLDYKVLRSPILRRKIRAWRLSGEVMIRAFPRGPSNKANFKIFSVALECHKSGRVSLQ